MASKISMSIIATLGYYIAKKTSTQQTFDKLTSISSKPAMEQKELLIDEFEKWKGSDEQTDDVLVVGIRF